MWEGHSYLEIKELEEHLDNKQGDITFYNPYCDVVTDIQNELDDHLSRKHTETLMK